MARHKAPSWKEIKSRLSKHFKNQPNANDPEVQRYNQKFLDEISDDRLPSLPAKSLSLHDVKTIFNIHEVVRQFHAVPEQNLLRVPPELEQEMRETVELLARDPKNEAECRLNVNTLFIHCLKAERRALATAPNPPPYLPSLTLESNLKLPVMHNGDKKMLNGDMDYSMYYANEDTATGLVILEAKAVETMGSGLSQCLTYMAMVHTIRKQRGYDNAVIHGIVSNGREFQFLRIDNDSKWCKWQPKNSWNSATRDEIYTLMRLIIRNAAMSSPRTSTQAVRRVSSSHPITAQPVRYHLRVGSGEDEMNTS